MKFTMTPLIMFLAIFILFLLSIYFVHNVNKEGFISYHYNAIPLNQFYISQYSTSHLVYKLYDSIYFDNKNGNIIELFGKQFSNTSNNTKTTNIIDINGSSLTDIIVISRPLVSHSKMILRYYDNSVSDVKVDNSIIEHKMTNSYAYDMIPNESTLYSNQNISYNYQILYISWGNDTIIHIYDCSNMKNVNIGTYLFRNGYDPNQFTYQGNLTSSLGNYNMNDILNNQNNSFIPEMLYDVKKQNSLFQLTSNILFDTTCRYLIIRNRNSISVYDGTMDDDNISPKMIYSNITENGKIINTPNSINMDHFNKFRVLYIYDTEGSNLILYMAIPSTKKTVIAVLCKNPSSPNHLIIKNVKTFNQDNVGGSGLDGFEVPIVNLKPKIIEKPTEPVLCGANYITDIPNLNNPNNNNNDNNNNNNNNNNNYYNTHWNENHINDFLLTNKFKTPENEINPPTDSLGKNIDDFISNLSKIRISENTDSSGNKTIEYKGSLNRNNYLDSFIKQITGISLSEVPISSTTSTTTSLPTSTTTTTPSPSLPTPTSTSPLPTPVQINPPTQPFQKIDYGNDLSYVYTSSVLAPGPTFGNRLVPEGIPDYYSYYGAIPEKEPSNFIPLSSDFSKFGM